VARSPRIEGKPRIPRLGNPEIERVAKRVRRVFSGLDSLPYIGSPEREDFRYYENLLEDSLVRIDRKAAEGRLRPLDLRDFPQCLRYPGYTARIGIFIGSFDPFQMTHLAMALRYLASDAAEADVVFVVPEGAYDSRKPGKTEYRFRYEVLRRQLAGVLDPLVVPLDIGEGADTIEIVRRLTALHPGATLRLTHILGSDTLPIALRLLPDDLEAWTAAAERHRVSLDFSIFVVRREGRTRIRPLVEAARRLGVRVVVDRRVIGTPSSTAFRSDRAITIVFPTDAILSRLELLFRYGMNRPWSLPRGEGQRGDGPRPDAPAGPIDFEI
jgi:nicotinic acid mononucleotide adenylyltransferase